MALAELVDRQPLNVLHDQIGAAVRHLAAVQQTHHVWMIERCQDLPLDANALCKSQCSAGLKHLDCDPLLKATVIADAQVDPAHAAAAQAIDQAIIPKPRLRDADLGPGALGGVRAIEEACRLLVGGQQRYDFLSYPGIGGACEQRTAAGGRQLLGLREQRFNPLPAIVGHVAS